MDRRKFLTNSGLAFGATLALPALSCSAPLSSEEHTEESFADWGGIRNQFLLAPDRIHMAQMLFASHPTSVRNAIEKHRKHFDENPVLYWEQNFITAEKIVCEAAAKYLMVNADEIALTDSTSMGLGILYTGLKLKEGDEILTTTHDHYATEKSLEFAASRNKASIRRISFYDDPATTTVEAVGETLRKAITPETKIVAVTWVHSSTGVKLPIREMATVIKDANAKRDSASRIYFCVDGVHGLGIENLNLEEMGCDFFSAGTHKWIFGPRGTGILWGRKDAWDMVVPVIPSFGDISYFQWLGQKKDAPLTFSDWCSPGGFHTFEHRWALNVAFEFQLKIGKAKVEERTHQLSSLLKSELQKLKHIKLKTPIDPNLSSGINCFEVDGITPEEVVKKLLAKNIIISNSPYKVSYARITPCISNSEEEVMACIKALKDIRS